MHQPRVGRVDGRSMGSILVKRYPPQEVLRRCLGYLQLVHDHRYEPGAVSIPKRPYHVIRFHRPLQHKLQ